MGVVEAVGRLVEFGERQRRAQAEAARSLLLRDRYGGQEGVLRGRGVRGLPMRPMQFRLDAR